MLAYSERFSRNRLNNYSHSANFDGEGKTNSTRGMTPSGTSKPRTCLSYDKKRRLIANADAKKYMTQKSLAAAYGISEVVASEIPKGQCEKVEKVTTEGELEMNRKRTKHLKCENVDNALIE